uniref:PKD_channel domain-containing protein n=1 Tax=Macrostomum lignano TaxID=282301 RepID=A0A1I8FAA5_9PLAT
CGSAIPPSRPEQLRCLIDAAALVSAAFICNYNRLAIRGHRKFFVINKPQEPTPFDFVRGWTDYVNGFGNEDNFWTGLPLDPRPDPAVGRTMRMEAPFNGMSYHCEYSGFLVEGPTLATPCQYGQPAAQQFQCFCTDSLSCTQGMKFQKLTPNCNGYCCPLNGGERNGTDYVHWDAVGFEMSLKEIRLMVELLVYNGYEGKPPSPKTALQAYQADEPDSAEQRQQPQPIRSDPHIAGSYQALLKRPKQRLQRNYLGQAWATLPCRQASDFRLCAAVPPAASCPPSANGDSNLSADDELPGSAASRQPADDETACPCQTYGVRTQSGAPAARAAVEPLLHRVAAEPFRPTQRQERHRKQSRPDFTQPTMTRAAMLRQRSAACDASYPSALQTPAAAAVAMETELDSNGQPGRSWDTFPARRCAPGGCGSVAGRAEPPSGPVGLGIYAASRRYVEVNDPPPLVFSCRWQLAWRSQPAEKKTPDLLNSGPSKIAECHLAAPFTSQGDLRSLSQVRIQLGRRHVRVSVTQATSLLVRSSFTAAAAAAASAAFAVSRWRRSSADRFPADAGSSQQQQLHQNHQVHRSSNHYHPLSARAGATASAAAAATKRVTATYHRLVLTPVRVENSCTDRASEVPVAHRICCLHGVSGFHLWRLAALFNSGYTCWRRARDAVRVP